MPFSPLPVNFLHLPCLQILLQEPLWWIWIIYIHLAIDLTKMKLTMSMQNAYGSPDWLSNVNQEHMHQNKLCSPHSIIPFFFSWCALRTCPISSSLIFYFSKRGIGERSRGGTWQKWDWFLLSVNLLAEIAIKEYAKILCQSTEYCNGREPCEHHVCNCV